jgi:hypothetical protein
VRIVVCPTHTEVGPVIGTTGLTITGTTTIQPEARAYSTITVPEALPVRTPVTGLILPIAGLLLNQVPPGTVLVNAVVLPTHTLVMPPIGDGASVTVTVITDEQPPGDV